MDKPKLMPRDFFLYVGALATLYWSAGALVGLLFSIIDTLYRDTLHYFVDPYSGGIRFAIASLLTVFPLSLILFALIKRGIVREPAKLLLSLRKWLFALTIFAASATLLGDLIALINGYLGGDLSARFIWKALALFVVAGIVFWYCLVEMRVKPEEIVGVRKPFLIGTALFVLASIVYGFVVMGSPATIRALRFDERRASDLQSIQWQVVNFWQQKQRMPKTLAELEDPLSGYAVPTDPATHDSYELTLTGGYSFEMCASFALPSKTGTATIPEPKGLATDSLGDNWEHAAGRACFPRTIDPERYPPYAKTR